jgi:hypothetical protein
MIEELISIFCDILLCNCSGFSVIPSQFWTVNAFLVYALVKIKSVKLLNLVGLLIHMCFMNFVSLMKFIIYTEPLLRRLINFETVFEILTLKYNCSLLSEVQYGLLDYRAS